MRKRGVDGFRVLQSEEKEKYQTIMLQITLDMYQTLAAAVVVLALGRFLRGRVRLLERFCIPAPVIGGVLFVGGILAAMWYSHKLKLRNEAPFAITERL